MAAVQDTDVQTSGYGSPYIDALIWGCRWLGGPITFAFAESPGAPPGAPVFAPAWTDTEKNALRLATQKYSEVCGLQFQEIGNPPAANINWWKVPQGFIGGTAHGTHQYPNADGFSGPIHGTFAHDGEHWPDLSAGSHGFYILLHELGHGMGLAHPHDDDSDEPDPENFPDPELDQSVFTVMSYNAPWENGGFAAGPMAFDIAALQHLYGANNSTRTGNDTYELPQGFAAGWNCIWDAGGRDTISNAGSNLMGFIDLRPAPLNGENAGGFLSFAKPVPSGVVTSPRDGFTIAAGVIIENAIGGFKTDELIGNDHVNTLSGGAGDDWLYGHGGGDTLDGGAGFDRMAGGPGDDVYHVDDSSDSITEHFEEGADIVHASVSYGLAPHVEHLLQGETAGDIDALGNDLRNVISGSAGNNLLQGVGGDDSITGNGGNDRIFGGAGIDNLLGGSGHDLIDGGGDRDFMSGHAGDDTYVVDNAADSITENAGEGADTVRASISYTLADPDVENLLLEPGALNGTGNGANNTIVGNAGTNTLRGEGGNDHIDGGAGGDALFGGAGDDLYLVDNAGDTVTENAGEGDDTVRTSVSYTLTDVDVENLILEGAALNGAGNAGANRLTGNAENNLLDGGGGNDILEGGGGVDTLEGGAGVDTMRGGAGDDRYNVDATGDAITEQADEGLDRVFSTASYLLSANVENLILLGTADLDGTGNDQANQIIGNDGRNALAGGIGADELFGAGGDDILDGEKGADILAGGSGNDNYHVENTGDQVQESAGQGIDRVFASVRIALAANVENLTLVESAGVLGGFGNADNNQIVGNSASNAIDGRAGDDTLFGGGGDDRLIGGDGNDTLVGGDGHDLSLYGGTRAGYDVRTFLSGGVLATRVADVTADFSDLAVGVEAMQFGAGVFTLAGAQLNRGANVSGSRFDDVIFQNAADGQVLYGQMIDGAFVSWGVVTGATGGGGAFKAIASGDVNPGLTGGAEVFIQQQSNGSILFASLDSGATQWGVVSAALTSDWKLRAAGDVNGDASVDAIVQHAPTGQILYANMAGGAFSGWGVVNQNLTADWVAVGAGDLNRDGFADVVVQDTTNGTTFYANMAGGNFSGWGVVSNTLTADWKAVAVADVTGDGFAEVMFQNLAGSGVNPGTTYFADVSTGAVQWGVVTSSVTAEWIVQGAADVDNDGYADVLFQHAPSGDALYADMNAGVFAGWGVVSQNITADWQVV